jgi:hypothetical protein
MKIKTTKWEKTLKEIYYIETFASFNDKHGLEFRKLCDRIFYKSINEIFKLRKVKKENHEKIKELIFDAIDNYENDNDVKDELSDHFMNKILKIILRNED